MLENVTDERWGKSSLHWDVTVMYRRFTSSSTIYLLTANVSYCEIVSMWLFLCEFILLCRKQRHLRGLIWNRWDIQPFISTSHSFGFISTDQKSWIYMDVDECYKPYQPLVSVEYPLSLSGANQHTELQVLNSSVTRTGEKNLSAEIEKNLI